MELIYSFTVALFITIAFIPVLIKHSAKLNLLDDPTSDRKMHTQVIPRSGGIAMALGVFSPLFFLIDMDGIYKGIYFGAIIIVVFGILDDIYELDYKWKFGGQIIAVITLMLSGIGFDDLPFFHLDETPRLLAAFITFMFVLGVTNAVNLTDGLDGLAGGTTLISLLLIAVLAINIENNTIALFAITTIGGIMGFLRYNTHPAKIFMGDAGSQFLGFVTAALAIVVTQAPEAAYNPAIPLLIVGLPVLDTMTVMFIRLKEKRSPFSPDKNHLHHQIIKLKFYHNEAVAIIYIIQIMLAIVTYYLCYKSDLNVLGFYVLFSAVIVSVLYYLHKIDYQFRNVEKINYRERRNKILREMDWLYNSSGRVIEFFFCVLLLASVIMVTKVSYDIAIVSTIIAIASIIFYVIKDDGSDMFLRVITYTASVFAVYLLSLSDGFWINAIDIGLVVMALFLMVAIRITRKEDFSLDNQDLLILIMIVVVPQLPFPFMEKFAVAQVVLRLAVLMYACELILAKSKGRKLMLFRIGVFSSLIIMAIRGFN